MSLRTLINDFEQNKWIGILGVEIRDVRVLLDENVQTLADLQNVLANAPGPAPSDFMALRDYLKSYGVELKLVSAGLDRGALFGTAGSLAAAAVIPINSGNFTKIKTDFGKVAEGAGVAASGAGGYFAILYSVATAGSALGTTACIAALGAAFSGLVVVGVGAYFIYEGLEDGTIQFEFVESPNTTDVGSPDGGVTTPEATLFGDPPVGVDTQQLVLELAADPSQISDGWDNGQPIELGLDEGGSLPGGNAPGNPWGWGSSG